MQEMLKLTAVIAGGIMLLNSDFFQGFKQNTLRVPDSEGFGLDDVVNAAAIAAVVTFVGPLIFKRM